LEVDARQLDCSVGPRRLSRPGGAWEGCLQSNTRVSTEMERDGDAGRRLKWSA
jgi:hypothetical protein